jgi:hypothetical protein
MRFRLVLRSVGLVFHRLQLGGHVGIFLLSQQRGPLLRFFFFL